MREKINSETTDGSEEAAYATNVPEAKVRLVLSYNGKVSDDDIPDWIKNLVTLLKS